MGARTNIQLKYSDGNSVYIYSHWGGEGGARERLKAAIDRKDRWDDEMYMAAIILREMLRDSLDSGTGWGVQPYPGEESYVTTVVDLDAKTVDGEQFADWMP